MKCTRHKEAFASGQARNRLGHGSGHMGNKKFTFQVVRPGIRYGYGCGHITEHKDFSSGQARK